MNFADRLLEAIEQKGSPVCVGLDPVVGRLPEELRPPDGAGLAEQARAVEAYCRGVLEAVGPVVPAVKPQSAYFEALGSEGVRAYFQTVAHARRLGLVVIGDVKRNDIGSTAEAYAQGHLGGQDSADAITVNGYLGEDGIQPFARAARAGGRGLFVLVRTSNPSAKAVQDFADADGQKLYEHVGRLVSRLGDGEGLVGRRGYSCLGAVVGATWVQEARRLRQLMPRQIFLVPGYGAQGASADDCAASFNDDGMGAVVNASRSVIFAYESRGGSWTQAVRQAGEEFAREIAAAVEKRRGIA